MSKITRKELRKMILESFGSYQDKLNFGPMRSVEEYTPMARALIEKERKFYPAIFSVCDENVLLEETIGYLAYADQPGMGPNFRRGAEGVYEIPMGAYEAAVVAKLGSVS